MRTTKIGIIGEFKPTFRPHQVLDYTLEQSANSLNIELVSEWIETDQLTDQNGLLKILGTFDGLWCSPGSPYKSLEGALNGIRYARENNIPLIGTCAGFQHIILEYARNVLGFSKATSGEYTPEGETLFITPLDCSLAGQTLTILLKENSFAFQIWKQSEIKEYYYCNFGLNPRFVKNIQESSLIISGFDRNNEPRIIELPAHPFFIGTLFVPGNDMNGEHPLINAFVKACATTIPLKKRVPSR